MSSPAPGVYAGSTSGTGEPGIANAGSDESARLWAEVYAACVRRRSASLSQPRKRVSEPVLPAPAEVKQKKRWAFACCSVRVVHRSTTSPISAPACSTSSRLAGHDFSPRSSRRTVGHSS